MPIFVKSIATIQKTVRAFCIFAGNDLIKNNFITFLLTVNYSFNKLWLLIKHTSIYALVAKLTTTLLLTKNADKDNFDMDFFTNWADIRKHFNKSFRTNFHVSIASVDKDNNPTVTPIGSFFLNNNQTGFYFEKFPTKLPENSKANKQIYVLGVNSSTFFWLTSLFSGQFKSYPAIKLYGQLGDRQKATDLETKRLKL